MPTLPNPGPFTMPGFGLPLNWAPPPAYYDQMLNLHRLESLGTGERLFPNALQGDLGLKLFTLCEIEMMRFMNEITDKPQWYEKVFNPTITSKWKSELFPPSADPPDPHSSLSPSMFEYCILELQWRAHQYKEKGYVVAFQGDIVKSDSAVPEELRVELSRAIEKLEEMAQAEGGLDWHPRSDGKVLDLVHPSLFPLIYGRTRILPSSFCTLDDCITRCSEGITLPIPPKEECEFEIELIGSRGRLAGEGAPWSRKYQWLPCEVEFCDKGEGSTEIRITSYINNLHPHHPHTRPLYTLLSRLISHVIPLWNRTLTSLCLDGGRCKTNPERITYSGPEYFNKSDEPDEPAWDEDLDILRAWWTANLIPPEVNTWEIPGTGEYGGVDEKTGRRWEEGIRLERDWRERGLQVIVKIANIELTPEKSEYEGGAWHVEGQLNEHICASAIYYHSSSNITASSLAFRQQSNPNEQFRGGQDEHTFLPQVYGFENEDPAIQELGSIATPEGRLITFPNVMQHKVERFELADKTKRGWRKIVALFLVDPNIRIISTKNVPVQRKDWWFEELNKTRSFDVPRNHGQTSSRIEVPLDVQLDILSHVDGWPIGMDEAKEMREELMKERSVFVRINEERMMVRSRFSLCEH